MKRVVVPILALAVVLVLALGAVAMAATPTTMVSGGGTFVDEQGKEFGFGFTARVMEDGSVEGQLEFHNRADGNMIHVRIDSLEVTGGTAVLGGVITKAVGGNAVVGDPRVVQVVDNGEGASAAPDRMSKTSKTLQDTHQLVHGNIQVR